MILSFFSDKKKPIYFITKNFKGELSKKSDLVLSPEFYWAKKVILNVKYSYEASKMAPSVFDGILPDGDFRYKVFKTAKKEFVFIAYDMHNIINKLKLLGINMQMVNKIYALQSEFINRDVALRVNEEYGVVTNEGIVTYVPLKLLSSIVEVDISDVLRQKKLSGNYIYSKSFQRSSLNSKQTNQILSLLMILVLILSFDLLKVQKERNLIVEQKTSLIERYNLPKTGFQVKSIYNELNEIDKQQSDLNDAIKYIGEFKLSGDEFFNSLVYKKHILRFVVKLNSTKREAKFKTYISGKYKIIKTDRLKNRYMIEVGL